MIYKSALYLGVSFAILSLPIQAQAQKLEPFSSDGCSSFPDGTFEQQELWLQCCVAHDFAYWMGGTYQQRRDADNALQSCVAEVGEPQIAALMLAGVRVGGTPYLPTSFRWGYGWPFPRLYEEHSESELAMIRELIPGSEELEYCRPKLDTLQCTK